MSNEKNTKAKRSGYTNKSLESMIGSLFEAGKKVASFFEEHDGDIKQLIIEGGKIVGHEIAKSIPKKKKAEIIAQLLKQKEERKKLHQTSDKQIDQLLELLGYKAPAEATSTNKNTGAKKASPTKNGEDAHIVLLKELERLVTQSVVEKNHSRRL